MEHKLRGKSFKIQSAMEYLMTYGWAILIIAVVMVALFALGVFNSSNFAPRASAGACQVVRNVESTTLQGQCQGELPRYVAQFDGNSIISVANIPGVDAITSSGSASVTITVWASTSATGSMGMVNYNPGNAYGLSLGQDALYGGDELVYIDTIQYSLYSPKVSDGNLHFYAFSYDGNSIVNYRDVNGKLVVTTSSKNLNANAIAASSPLDIGNGWGGKWVGFISNVQIYNKSLSANDVQQLYQEGIGGAPIDPIHIVGWWPLNGNAQDYSGNSNNGKATGIAYTSAWTSMYTQP